MSGVYVLCYVQEDPELDTSGLSIEDVLTRSYGKHFPKQGNIIGTFVAV